MKKTYLAMAVTAASLVAQPALAQDYQMEAGLSYISYDYDAGGDDSAIGVDFRYNFETVSTAGKPLAEAQFLGRNGGVDLGYVAVDKADSTVIGVGADYWFEDIYVAATYSNVDDGNDKEGVVGIKAGYMLDDTLRVHLGFSDKGNVGGMVVDDSTISIGAKYIADMGGNFINLEGEFLNSSDYKTFGARGDFYFTNEFSAGIGLHKSDITSRDKVAVDLGAKYFVMPNVSGEISYTLNEGGVDKDTGINLRVAARF